MRIALISTILILLGDVCFSADQSITCGDGQFEWRVVTSYYSGGFQIGVQTNALVWTSDGTGFAVFMSLDKQVWSTSGDHLYDSYTALNPQGGNGITWRVSVKSPVEFFAGLYDSAETASTVTWADHSGVKTAVATTTDPDIYPHSVWVDWSKSSPRITFGSAPKQFNHWLSDGTVNH